MLFVLSLLNTVLYSAAFSHLYEDNRKLCWLVNSTRQIANRYGIIIRACLPALFSAMGFDEQVTQLFCSDYGTNPPVSCYAHMYIVLNYFCKQQVVVNPVEHLYFI